jgi:drug/metabolite transporter (DMT)-like permease
MPVAGYSSTTVGRLAVLVAVILMAGGKVAYGTWLGAVPSPIYVLMCFSLITAIFLPIYGRRTGEFALKPLLLLNVSTALCFLFFFYALKLIEPAVAGAVQFGSGPILSVLITLVATRARPDPIKALVCGGLVAGCVVLAVSAVTGAGFATDGARGWLGLGAILLSAIGSVLITIASKSLSLRGWSSGAILAHRCYLIVPLALALVLAEGAADVPWTPPLALTLLGIGLVGTIIPIVFLQIGIEKSDPHTVLVMLAAMPIFTFLIEGLSPLYVWSQLTAAGLAIIAVFIAIDIAFTRQKMVLSARTTSHGSGGERTDARVAKGGGVSMSD